MSTDSTNAKLYGLNSEVVFSRQQSEGPNELPTQKARTQLHMFAEIVREPMFLLLLACGLIYFVLGDKQEALSLLSFLVIIVGITFYQEGKAEKSLAALRELSSPRALVIRDGQKIRIPSREIVRGDIVLLEEGDRVPADGKLLYERNITADESLLTGESVPVEKSLKLKNSDPRANFLFAGTTVTRGQAILEITSIGFSTEIGKIGKSLQSQDLTKGTRLQKEARLLVKRFSWISIILCLILFIAYGLRNSAWLDGLLAGLALAMAILPNELPAVVVIFLALGAWRLSRINVLTRRVPAVEVLGSITALCVDKTGTLTQNKMQIQKLFASDQYFDLSHSADQFLPEIFHEVLEFGILASRKDPVDPMELAFQSSGLVYLENTEHLHPEWQNIKEYPLSSELLAVSYVWKSSNDDKVIVGAKGAAEAIIDLCHLLPDEAKRLSNVANKLASEGMRVLGVAKSKIHQAKLPEIQHDLDYEFVGFVGIADPIRPEVPQAVRECHEAQIRVIMITGDHPETAKSIARQIHLNKPEQVLTGNEFSAMSLEQLKSRLHTTNVFSRMMPDQKLKLVQLLKEQGEIVAMTGDGVNDAPALRFADIGVAMGRRGTDVAREAASIVLVDDDFSSIVHGIKAGRRIFKNLQNAMSYLFAVHIPIAGISLLPALLDLPLILLPIHIAFLHLIIEPVSSIAFEAQPADENLMKIPPRSVNESLFSRKIVKLSLVRGFIVFAAMAAIYLMAFYRGQGPEDARTLSFTTLVIVNLGLIFSSLRTGQGFKRSFRISNRQNLWVSSISIVLLIAALYIPIARETFRFSTLHWNDLLICLVVSILCFGLFELNKLVAQWLKA